MTDDEPTGFALEHMDQERPKQIARYGIKASPERVVLIQAELSDPLDKQTGAQLYDITWITMRMPSKEDIAKEINGKMNGGTDSDEDWRGDPDDDADENHDGLVGIPMMMGAFMMQPKMTEVPLKEVAEATGQKALEGLYNLTKTDNDPPFDEAITLRGMSAAEVHQLFEMSNLWARKRLVLEDFLTASHNTDLTMRMGAAYRSAPNDNNAQANNIPKEA